MLLAASHGVSKDFSVPVESYEDKFVKEANQAIHQDETVAYDTVKSYQQIDGHNIIGVSEAKLGGPHSDSGFVNVAVLDRVPLYFAFTQALALEFVVLLFASIAFSLLSLRAMFRVESHKHLHAMKELKQTDLKEDDPMCQYTVTPAELTAARDVRGYVATLCNLLKQGWVMRDGNTCYPLQALMGEGGAVSMEGDWASSEGEAASTDDAVLNSLVDRELTADMEDIAAYEDILRQCTPVTDLQTSDAPLFAECEYLEYDPVVDVLGHDRKAALSH